MTSITINFTQNVDLSLTCGYKKVTKISENSYLYSGIDESLKASIHARSDEAAKLANFKL